MGSDQQYFAQNEYGGYVKEHAGQAGAAGRDTEAGGVFLEGERETEKIKLGGVGGGSL